MLLRKHLKKQTKNKRNVLSCAFNSHTQLKQGGWDRRGFTYIDFEGLDCVVQQQYVAHNLCVLPVSLQLSRPDIVGSASRQAEARAHHAPTRVCNKRGHSTEEKTMSESKTKTGLDQGPSCQRSKIACDECITPRNLRCALGDKNLFVQRSIHLQTDAQYGTQRRQPRKPVQAGRSIGERVFHGKRMSIRKQQIPCQGDAAQLATSNTHGTTQDDTFYYFKRQLDLDNNWGHAVLFITSF